MKIFAIDKKGWSNRYESTDDAECSLESIDIENDEYTIIDDEGYVYRWEELSENYCGYKLVKTDELNKELLAKLVAKQKDEAFKI